MKTNQMIKRTLKVTLSITVLVLAACSTDTKKADETTGVAKDSTAVAEPAAKITFEDPKSAAVYENYHHLSKALVEGNATEAQSGAAALQTALTEAGSSKGADLAGKVASVKDLKAQRAELEALTAEVEKVVKSSKLTSGVIYKQYCPMANSNEGGYWLSSESEIKNPYFGDEMLNCGETKEEIK